MDQTFRLFLGNIQSGNISLKFLKRVEFDEVPYAVIDFELGLGESRMPFTQLIINLTDNGSSNH